VPSQVALAISQSNASRNVYLGGLDDGTTEEQLRDDLSRFGLIDQVKIVRDKNIGFVHFLSISVATKARFLLCLYLSCVLMFFSFQGCEHASHRTRVGRKAGQLWQRPLRVHPQVAASRGTSSPGCRGSIPCRTICCGVSQPHQHQCWRLRVWPLLALHRGWVWCPPDCEQDRVPRQHSPGDNDGGLVQCNSRRRVAEHTVHARQTYSRAYLYELSLNPAVD
jgi:hypothetical protein